MTGPQPTTRQERRGAVKLATQTFRILALAIAVVAGILTQAVWRSGFGGAGWMIGGAILLFGMGSALAVLLLAVALRILVDGVDELEVQTRLLERLVDGSDADGRSH